MTRLIPYLHFNGNTREAMTFYSKCLGGKLVLQKVAESPMAAKVPSEMESQILHSSLTMANFSLMASDMMGSHVSMGNNIKLCLNCSSDEEIRSFFEKLSEGGQVKEPLQQTFWGATFGAFTDKFGVEWMLNYSKN